MTPIERHRLEGDAYLTSLESDGERLARVAEGRLGKGVPTCPGWDVAELVWHTGGVHRFWGAIARGALQDPETVERPVRPPDDELIDWYLAGLSELIDTLRSADPATSVWTWTDEKNVAWIRRRMAHETAVHRWDAESASGNQTPIEPSLARDGIDEFFEFFIESAADAPEMSLHLHATDGAGEWLVRVQAGRLSIEHEHAKGDVAIRGEVSDLLLLLWGRIPEAEVEVLGDRSVLFAFLHLADLS